MLGQSTKQLLHEMATGLLQSCGAAKHLQEKVIGMGGEQGMGWARLLLCPTKPHGTATASACPCPLTDGWATLKGLGTGGKLLQCRNTELKAPSACFTSI